MFIKQLKRMLRQVVLPFYLIDTHSSDAWTETQPQFVKALGDVPFVLSLEIAKLRVNISELFI